MCVLILFLYWVICVHAVIIVKVDSLSVVDLIIDKYFINSLFFYISTKIIINTLTAENIFKTIKENTQTSEANNILVCYSDHKILYIMHLNNTYTVCPACMGFV